MKKTRIPALSTLATLREEQIEETAVALATQSRAIGTSGQAVQLAGLDPLTAAYVGIRCFLSRLGMDDGGTAHGLALNIRQYAASVHAQRIKSPRFDVRPVRDVDGELTACTPEEAEKFFLWERVPGGEEFIAETGSLDAAERIVAALSWGVTDVTDAAAALLRRLQNITTEDFSKGGEREEREELRRVLIAAGYLEFIP